MSNKVKAIAYCRATTKVKQNKGNSIEIQKQQISETAKRLNVEIVKWFEHVGSDKKYDYPIELSEAVRYGRQNRNIKYLLFTTPDRFGWSGSNFNYFNWVFEDLGVALIPANSHSLAKSPVAKFMGQLQAMIGQLDSEVRSERVKLGLRRKKELEQSMEE